MSFNWAEYHEVARHLNNQPATASISSEAFWRAAVSRAYYAAFASARDLGLSRNWFEDNKTMSVHRTVIDFFLYSRDSKMKTIGNRLDQLFRLRKTADYNEKIILDGSSCNLAIGLSFKIIEDLKLFQN